MTDPSSRSSNAEPSGEEFTEPPPPPQPGNADLIREIRRESDIGTAKRRLDENERRVQKKEKERREAREKLEGMGLDARGRIPGPPVAGDVEAQAAPGTDPWVVYLWQYATPAETEALVNAAWAAGLGVVSAAAVLSTQVAAAVAAQSNEDAAEARIRIGESPGANSTGDTLAMNRELGDAAAQGLTGAMFAPFASVVVAVGTLGTALIKYYSTRKAILARIRELARKYEEASAELDQLTANVEALNQELAELNLGR
ncbi:hypothetical protein [Amycolatopsis sp. PS_44_ISF1]|uniref:hypothetical protein n=1 Tax=Amycolatopsis sp. PS_44_ISF1 TaxID=2974917 RepID=UPI0028DF0BE8|nr:hypothetical protein [Amycolatopsis sp. PS_44_ISF1]MDT8913146.1 hypothetical protein [Amycolatopsis sp. PS_44_ISF1]